MGLGKVGVMGEGGAGLVRGIGWGWLCEHEVVQDDVHVPKARLR